MAYTKRYEDSYLDEEEDEFEGAGLSDGDRLVLILRKQNRSDKENNFVKKLSDRLTNWAKMPGAVGKNAIDGLIKSAEACVESGQNEKAIELWARLVDVSEALGNKELYYMATDRMANVE